MIFLLNKSQFSVNSVFVVKVKIPFSCVLNRLTIFASKLTFEGTSSFFLEQAKYTAIYTTMKLKTMFTNKWFSSLSIKNDCKRKKKDTWGGFKVKIHCLLLLN